MQRGIHKMRRIQKMRITTSAKECSQNPKVKKIDLYENRTTEGGESKVCQTTEGGESKVKIFVGLTKVPNHQRW